MSDDPVDEAVLSAHLRRVDGDTCTALAADLWAARGYETRVRDGDVLAERDGHTTVVRPMPSAGSGGDRRADVVVAPGGNGDATADLHGARLVDAEGLAEMLLYAVDRESAVRLCERHLGAAPGALAPPLPTRLRRSGRRALAAAPPLPLVLVAVALVGLAAATGGVVVTLDAAAPAGPGGEPTATPTAAGTGPADAVSPTGLTSATDTPMLDPASLPPGVTARGLTDADALAAAHQRALSGRSYTVWADLYRPRDGERIQYDVDAAVAGDRYVVRTNLDVVTDRTRIQTVYADGGGWYLANQSGEGTTYRRGGDARPPTVVPTPPELARVLVTRYLSTPQTAVARTGGDGSRYLITGRGQPSAPGLEGVRDYRAEAVVDGSGFVWELVVTYTDRDGDAVRFEVTYGRLGETTVDRPRWVGEQFGGNETDGDS